MAERQMIVAEESHVVKGGETVTVRFPARITEEMRKRYKFRLQLRGEVGIHPSLMYEGGIPLLYRDIDDSLSTETDHSRFSLKITCKGEDYPRRAFYRIDCPPRINSQYPVPESRDVVWKFSGTVKTEDFFLQEGGTGEVRFESYWKREGRDSRDISGEPDEVTVVPLPEGTANWRQISGKVRIGDETAAVLVCITVEGASGTVWLEDFSLKNSTGFNILPLFDLTNKYHPFANWLGENLSRKEWTSMKVSLNGTELGTFELFQRCFAGSENEILVPRDVLRAGENELTLTNCSDYFCPAPYTLSRLALHLEESGLVKIVYCPEYPAAGREFGILVCTERENEEIRFRLPDGISGKDRCFFRQAGLHAVRFLAGEASGGPLTVYAEAGDDTDEAKILRIVEKKTDGVTTGSGDAVYIPQQMEEMEEFLCWFLSNHLGDLVTFRPVYRWCGSRTCHPDVWKRIAKLLNELDINYCYISDGRELPGINANPTDEMLAGRHYLGSQGHERDGAFYYWLQTARMVNETLYEQVSRKICCHPDYTYRTPFEYGREDVYYNFSPVKCKDMEEGARQFVEKAAMSLKGIKRHTGPSTLFKYFFEAGLEVGGAELMYGPLEVVLSALRGASIAYGRDVFTAHLAVQWGTTPHDSQAHFRRFALALFLSYLHGCHHINTEEGFYRMEELFAQSDRFSKACVGHADVQRKFVRFVSTHSRRGKLVSPIALLHGINDAWVCFTRRNAWSQEGEEWKFGTPEESWDLIKVFYPDSVLDAIYRHPCPNEPQGYYTRTPYGTVDILPVEADGETYRRYGHLAFLGFNTADEGQVKKLVQYVSAGGKLLLGWCHLLTDKDRSSAIFGIPHPIDAKELTGSFFHGFLPQRDGITLGDLSLSETDLEEGKLQVIEERGGIPFLLRHRIGKGSVYFVNAREYPSSPGVRGTYERILRSFGQEAVQENLEKGYLTGSDTVGSAVYDLEDGKRQIYAVNTDWWSAVGKPAKAHLFVGGRESSIRIPRDTITQILIRGEAAAATSELETEILDLESGDGFCRITLQGDGICHIRIFGAAAPKEGKEAILNLSGKQTVEISYDE